MRLLADENFDNRILRGIRRENADVDLVRVQDTKIYTANDHTVLEWAAREGRIVLTHDIKTMPKFVYARIREGKLMLGVIVVTPRASIGEAIEDILILLGANEPEEFEDQVIFLPL